ncbi:MAG: thioesterase family protein [Thermodesulfobacteriota bacterium]
MAFRARLKVCFGDIDHAGIVYYPRFVHYFHVALEDFFGGELGIEYAAAIHQSRVTFPTVHLEADFRRRLHFGDHIEVEVRVLKIGRTSITWGYRAFRTGPVEELVVEGHNVTVCTDPDTFVKQEVPAWLRERLEDYRGRCGES